MKKRVLVFPSGSEIGLEIYRSVSKSNYFELIGATSIDDHGGFVYEQNIYGVPFFNDPYFIDSIREIVIKHKVDAIFPTMDSVMAKLSEYRHLIDCKIVAPANETVQTCLSKKKTINALGHLIKIPKLYNSLDEVQSYPVFLKLDVGYSGKGCIIANNRLVAEAHLSKEPGCLILEYLPGKEYTIDCFTNSSGVLLFCGARERQRISNGISVRTETLWHDQKRFEAIALSVNSALSMKGAWFLQLKENSEGALTLLEVACRLGGSSGLYRMCGVNFALLSLFDLFDYKTDLVISNFDIVQDRPLASKYRINISFSKAYVDFDDCLIIDGRVNHDMVKLLYQFINDGVKVILITKCKGNIYKLLAKYRMDSLFDDIININEADEKSNYIDPVSSIFIDDSFTERKKVHERTGIIVFSPDAIDCLLK